MKNTLLLGTMLVSMASLFTACEDDRDSNPTLIQPTDLVLNTPAYINETINLENSSYLKLTWSQPKFTADNAPVNATYEIQVSPTNSFTVSAAEADADESGALVADYDVLPNTVTTCHAIFEAQDLDKALIKVASAREDLSLPRNVYFILDEFGNMPKIEKFDKMMDWLADLYVNILNLIHYMHDKYYYEAAEMALIDTDVRRTFATGIAGLSHVADSLSAIKYAKVKVIRDDQGCAIDFKTEGDFPKYGNDDPRADEFAVWLLKTFMEKIKKNKTYRNSEPTTSVLTITSNVVYGKATGALPDGREAYKPFAPGASPSYGAEQSGLLASLNSVAKLPYEYALDGISNTQTMAPSALGHDLNEQKETLVRVMDGYFDRGAHHLNVNVFGTEKLLDAQAHPEKPEYANFTIRVSGYAVKFISLTKEQQDDVIARTCHKSL